MPTATKTTKKALKKVEAPIEVEQTENYRKGYLQAVAEAVSTIDNLTKILYLDSKLNESELAKCLETMQTLRRRVQVLQIEQG